MSSLISNPYLNMIGNTNDVPVLGELPINVNTGLENKPVDYYSIIKNSLEGKLSSPFFTTSVPYTGTKAEARVLGDKYNPNFSDEYKNYILAENQSKADQFANSMYNLLVGELIGGGLEGAGYLLGVGKFAKFALTGEGDFMNGLAKIGSYLRDKAREDAQIFVDPSESKFAPTRFDWWMQNLPTVASSIALMYPSAFAARGTLEGLKLLGLLKGGVKDSALLTGVIQAFYSRQAESVMEGRQTYDELLNKYLKSGIDLNTSKELARKGLINTYVNNWPLVFQDIPQYILLNRLGLGLPGKTGSKVIEKSLQGESSEILRLLGLDAEKIMLKRGFSIANDIGGEGAEEGYQFIVQKRTEAIQDNKAGLSDQPGSLFYTIGESVKQGDFWTNVFWGAAGAGLMHLSQAGINSKIVKTRTEALQKELKKWGSLYSDAVKTYYTALESENIVNRKHAFNQLVNLIATRAASSGTVNHAKQFFKQLANNPNSPELKELGIDISDTGDFFSKNEASLEEVFSILDDASKNYNIFLQKAKNFIESNNQLNSELNKKAPDLKNNIINSLASNATTDYLSLKSNRKALDSINEVLNNMQDIIKNYDDLLNNPSELTFLQLSTELAGLKRAEKFFEDRLKDNSLSEDELLDIKNNLAKKREEIGKLERAGVTPVSDDELKKVVKYKTQKNIIEENIRMLEKKISKYNNGDFSGAEEIDSIELLEDVEPKKGNVVGFINREGKPSYGEIVDFYKPEDIEKDVTELDDDLQRAVDAEELTEDEAINKQSARNKTLFENSDYVLKVRLINENGELTDNYVTISYSNVEEFIEDIHSYIEDSASDGLEEISHKTPAFTDIDEEKTHPISLATYYNEIKIFNKSLNKVLSNPSLDKSNIRARFSIDIGSDDEIKRRWEQFKKDKHALSAIIDKVINNKKLNENEIQKLLSVGRKSKEFNEIVDNIPISITIFVGNKAYKSGIYLHNSSSVKIYNISNLETPDDRANRLAWEMQLARNTRKAILEKLLSKEKVWTDNISIGRGHPTVEDIDNHDEAVRVKRIDETLELEEGEAHFAISIPHLEGLALYTDANTVLHESANITVPGAVYLITNRTINGKLYALKLNRRFISKRDAGFILRAFEVLGHTMNASNKKGKYWAQFPKGLSKDVYGLSVGQALDLLVEHGRERTDPDFEGYKNKAELSEDDKAILRQYRLYVELKNGVPTLFYGSDENGNPYMLDLTRRSDRYNHFTSWLSSTKGYSVRLEMRTLNTKLNSPLKRSFKIGDIEHDGRGTYGQFLMKNRMIGTDAVMNDNGLVFELPSINLNLVDDEGNVFIKTGEFTEESKTSKEQETSKTEPTETENEPGEEQEGKEIIENEDEVSKEINEVKDIFSDINGGIDNSDPDDEFARNKSDVKSYKVQDLNKELSIVFNRFGIPKDNVKIVDNIIKMSNDGKVKFGVYVNNMIVLYRAAEVGTIYHEAFHLISRSYLSEDERNKLYRAAKQIIPDGKDKSNKEVEEWLAEEFRKYVLNKESKPRTIKYYFDRLVDLINTFVDIFFKSNKINYNRVDDVFEAIYRSKFKNKEPLNINTSNSESDIFYREYYDYDSSKREYITKLMSQKLIELNNLKDFKNIKSIDFNLLKTWMEETSSKSKSKIKRVESLLLRDDLSKEDRKSLETLKNQLSNLYDLMDSAIKDFDILVIEVSNQLLNYNLVIKDTENSNLYEFGNSESKQDFYKSDIEKSIKENATAEIKFMMSTLHDKTLIDDFAKSIGLIPFVNANKVWIQILNDLKDISNIDEAIDILEKKSASAGISYYKELSDKLKKSPSHIKAQFVSVVRNHKHKFLTFNATSGRNPNMFVYESSEEQYAIEILSKWNELFQFDTSIFSIKPEGNVYFNKDFITSFVKDFLNLKKDKKRYEISNENINNDIKNYNNFIRKFNSILSSLNIDINWKDLKSYINTFDGETKWIKLQNVLNLFERNVVKPISDKSGVSFNASNFIINNTFFNSLSRFYTTNHPEELPSVTVGPGDSISSTAMFFTYGLNNALTDETRSLKKDNSYVEQKSKAIYNRHSLILNKLLNDNTFSDKFGIGTFLSFQKGGQISRSSKYKSLSPIEDMLVRIAAIYEGFLPMPILADRGTYYFIKGFKPFEKPISIKDGKLYFSNDVLEVFYGYYLDEVERIEHNKKLLDDIKKARGKHKKELESQLIKNYKDNSTRFIDFKEFNKLDYKSLSKTEVIAIIEKSLKNVIGYELEHLNNLDLIAKDTHNNKIKYSNKMLPSNLLLNNTDGNLTSNLQIIQFVGTYTVYNMVGLFESQKLYTGDPAFYSADKKGDVEIDFYKRTFGLGSSGLNISEYINDEFKPTYRTAIFNTQKFKTEYYDILFEKHKQYYKKLYISKNENYNEKEAEKYGERMAKEALSEYESIDPTDGQLFIRPEMFKSIYKRLGRFTPDMEKAFDMLNSDKDLSLEEEIELLNIVMRPIKTVYIGNHLENGLDIPIYDKMSMATLFKRFIKGTNLEAVLNRMNRENDEIDVIKFDSAVKVGLKKGFNLYADGQNRTNLNNLDEIPVYDQYFKNLRYQVETDEHNDYRSLVSSQVPKIIMADIDPEKTYNGVKGSELIKNFIDSRIGLVENGKESLDSAIGSLNNNLNKAKLISKLRADSLVSGKPREFIDSLRVENNEAFIELDSFPDRMWFYSRLNSLISRNVVDLNLPTKQLIQVSDFGFKSTSGKDVSKEYKRELKFLRKESNNKIVYELEARVTISLFRNIIPNYDALSFKEKKEFIESNNVKLIGFRVPTQGKSSIVSIKVKEVIPEQLGDVIQLPLEFTALTGSDFDIDKLFVIHKNMYFKKNELKEIEYKNISDEQLYKDKALEIFFTKRGFLDESFVSEIDEEIENNKQEIEDFYANQYEMLKALKNERKKLRKILKTANKLSEDTHGKLLDKLTMIEDSIESVYDLFHSTSRSDFYKELSDQTIEKIIKYEVSNKILPPIEQFKELPLRRKLIRKANENRLIDIMFHIIESEELFVESTTPLGVTTKRLKEKAKKIESILQSDDKEGLPMFISKSVAYQNKTKIKFAHAKNGTSRVVLHKAHHAIAQIVGLKINTSLLIGDHDKESGVVNLDSSRGLDGILISDWFSALIDAHVDAAKDPYIVSLNVNDSTYSEISYLLRAGYGEKTFDLMLEPIIRSYTTEFFNNSGYITTSGRNGTPSETAIEIVSKKWLDHYNSLSNTNYKNLDELFGKNKPNYNDVLDLVSLDDNKDVVNKINNPEFVKKQLMILDVFSRISEDGGALNTLTVGSRIDVSGYGINPMMYRKAIRSLTRVVESQRFVNANKIYRNSGEYVEGDLYFTSMVENGIKYITKLLSNVTILNTKGFATLFDYYTDILPRRGSFMSTRSTIHLNNALYTYLFSKFFTSSNSLGITQDNILNIINPYNEKSVFATLASIKNGSHKYSDELNKNFFINNITINNIDSRIDKDVPLKVYIKTHRFDSSDSESINAMIDGFYKLFTHPDDEVRRFAFKLLIYSFYTTGFRNTLNGFTKYIPPRIMKSFNISGIEVSFNSYVKSLLSKLNNESDVLKFMADVRDEIAKNNWGNEELVPSISKNFVDNIIQGKSGDPLLLITKIPAWNTYYKIGSNHKGQGIYTGYLTHEYNGETYLFKYLGYDPKNNKQYYKVITKKGFNSVRGVFFHEYGLGEKSLFKVNNIETSATHEDYIKTIKTKTSSFEEVKPEDQIVSYDSDSEYFQLRFYDIASSVINESYDSENSSESNSETSDKDNRDVTIKKIISGLQTGIDTMSLNIAKMFGVETGGTTTLGFRSEKGSNISEAKRFGVKEQLKSDVEEFKSSIKDSPIEIYYYDRINKSSGYYLTRTWRNVKDSDLTVYFTFHTNEESIRRGGLTPTMRFALHENKPFIVVTNPENVNNVKDIVNKIKNRTWVYKKKPDILVVSTPEELGEIINRFGVNTINFAGNRASSMDVEDEAFATEFFINLYSKIFNKELFEQIKETPSKKHVKKLNERTKQIKSEVNEGSYSTKENPIYVYVDGSDVNKQDRENNRVGYGIVVLPSYNSKDVYTISGTENDLGELRERFSDIEMSNPTMELYGLLQALREFKNTGEHLVIRQDYSGAVNFGFLYKLSMNSKYARSEKPWVKYTKSYIKYIVEEIEKIVKQIENNGGSVSIEWVPGHISNQKVKKYADVFKNSSGELDVRIVEHLKKYNDMVDSLARSTESKNTVTNFVNEALNFNYTKGRTGQLEIDFKNIDVDQLNKDDEAKKNCKGE